MRIFGKASKPYSQNSELRGYCGADSCAMRAKLSTNEIARNFKKAAKGAEAKDQILLNLAHFAASGTLCPPAASAFCSQNGFCVAQFMKVCV